MNNSRKLIILAIAEVDRSLITPISLWFILIRPSEFFTTHIYVYVKWEGFTVVNKVVNIKTEL